jgi:hypothetical protein
MHELLYETKATGKE